MKIIRVNNNLTSKGTNGLRSAKISKSEVEEVIPRNVIQKIENSMEKVLQQKKLAVAKAIEEAKNNFFNA